MKNPYTKMFSWHTLFTLSCLSPLILLGVEWMFIGIIIIPFGNLGLGAFLGICVYENDIKKWDHLQKKEYDEWLEDIDAGYKIRKEQLDKLRAIE